MIGKKHLTRIKDTDMKEEWLPAEFSRFLVDLCVVNEAQTIPSFSVVGK